MCFSCFSAGVGRSGTFVTLLWLMQLCVRGIQPNIRAAVEDLRLHRMWMVQNLVSSSTQIENIIVQLLKSADRLRWLCLSFFDFPFIYRTNTFLFISVSSIGSSGELQQGGKTDNSPKKLSQHPQSTKFVTPIAATCRFPGQVSATTSKVKPPAPGQREAGRGEGRGGHGTLHRHLCRSSCRAECSRS